MTDDDELFAIRLAYLNCGACEDGIPYGKWIKQIRWVLFWLGLETYAAKIDDPNPRWRWVGEGLNEEDKDAC